MKAKYSIPEMEVLKLQYDNVLTESGGGGVYVPDPTDPDYNPDEEEWNQG